MPCNTTFWSYALCNMINLMCYATTTLKYIITLNLSWCTCYVILLVKGICSICVEDYHFWLGRTKYHPIISLRLIHIYHYGSVTFPCKYVTGALSFLVQNLSIELLIESICLLTWNEDIFIFLSKYLSFYMANNLISIKSQ